MAGAPLPTDLERMLRDAQFEEVTVAMKPESAEYIKEWLPGSGAEQYVVSANITATKPVGALRAPVAVPTGTSVPSAAPKKAG